MSLVIKFMLNNKLNNNILKVCLTLGFVFLMSDCFAHGELIFKLLIGYIALVVFICSAILFRVNSQSFNHISIIKKLLSLIIMIVLIFLSLFLSWYIVDVLGLYPIDWILTIVAPLVTTIAYSYSLKKYIFKKQQLQ